MFKSIKAILLILIIATNINIVGAQIQKSSPDRISDQILVRMQKGQNPYELGRIISSDFELEVVKVLSQYSDIWLLKFNAESKTIEEVLNALNQLDYVLSTSPNRVVELRAAPNDPNFGSQWQYDNIDAESAWDITTGGTTPDGTDIVVALIESADLINHKDLKDNHWVNTAEIPNNGIDDDGNGYIDDYNGWNVGTDNDNIGAGNHGTSCAGMIGAKGNNGIGVTGINWDVKIMDIAGYNNPFTEANIIEAYNYALKARLLWNQTQGAEGAFVVATSASWGVDQGNPADYPIWCGFYEDLGEVGILNCGATTNQNYNVDVLGDVPSACPSDYMISVTATNPSDIIDFAGYGQTTIDVGAPGSNIYTTSPNNGYGFTNGTSFATPLTAGLIGLMYSIPCDNLEAYAKMNPQATADMVRQALFDGVDENGYLLTRTVTGGRINAKKSIDTLMNSICSTCLPLSNITTTSIGENQASIAFDKLSDTANYIVYIRIADTGSWLNHTTTDTTFTLSGLTSCTSYEYTVLSGCDNGEPDASMLQTFTTKGCGNCIDLSYCNSKAKNPTKALNVFSPSSIEGEYTFTATSNFGGDVDDGYIAGILVLVKDGSASPEEGCYSLINTNELENNIAVIMRGTCNFVDKVMNAQDAGASAAIIINNVPSAPFEMSGTNASITIPAVMISQENGNTLLASINNEEQPTALLGQQNEWINSFEINGNTYLSGDDDGYLFSSHSLTLTVGQTYPFQLEPGFGGTPIEEHYRIWIDLNQDGNFSPSEILYDSGNTNGTLINDLLVVPTTAALGSTRMRIQMAFQGLSSSTLPDSCGIYYSGEVEDYCVTLNAPLGTHESKIENKVVIYPNPSKGKVHITKNSSAAEAVIYNPNGQLINKTQLTSSITEIDTKEWTPGIYFVHILDKDGGSVTIQKLSILP